jgi:hypothetical protein
MVPALGLRSIIVASHFVHLFVIAGALIKDVLETSAFEITLTFIKVVP